MTDGPAAIVDGQFGACDGRQDIGARLDRDDDLGDFSRCQITFGGVEKRVTCHGRGPAVVVMTEMPGISPLVARFARWVRDAGFTVYMPSHFGRDGAVADSAEGAAVWKGVCVSAEFRAFGFGRSSPVTSWLRALARLVHDECGGRGVGAIGMCFTGTFTLSVMLEPSMLAPVLSQPSLPIDEPTGLEIPPKELAQVRRGLERDDLKLLAYRFEGDPISRAARFDACSKALGDRLVGRTISNLAANKEVPSFFEQCAPATHSVVTVHLIDEAGQPTVVARDEILEFFKEVLKHGMPETCD